MEQLRKEGIVNVKVKQISNFLKIQRKKVYGTTQFSLQDLVDWSIAHGDRPIDENTANVAAYEYSTVPERNFKVFLTPKRLMQYTKHVTQQH
jgi:hypothetical protein